MGRIVVSEFISLDGVIEAPGGGEGFRHDGWTFDFEQGEEGQAFKLEETMNASACCSAASPTRDSPPPGPRWRPRQASSARR